MRQIFIILIGLTMTVLLTACSQKGLPEGYYRINFDNMEPIVMKNAIVRTEEIEDPGLLQVGDYILLNWIDQKTDRTGYSVFVISTINVMTQPGTGTSYYLIAVSSINNDKTYFFSGKELNRRVIEIENPS